MGSEGTTPRLFGDPCHRVGDIYNYFAEQAGQGAPLVSEPSSSSSSSCGKKPLKSMLVTGFACRDWDSLKDALLDDDQHDQMLRARYDSGEEYGGETTRSVGSGGYFYKPPSKTTSTSSSQASSQRRLSLRYLMGLAEEQEEYDEMSVVGATILPSIQGEAEEEVDPRLTLAMRRARQFLRDHRIFEFFRFLIAHMLSELPDNPIEFLIDLLDKCLLYRSGFGNPPLLFEKRHLEQLFNLMDPMRTGEIDLEQFLSGMKTLGICSKARLKPYCGEGCFSKASFVEEAYEGLTDLFVEMIRRRGGNQTPSQMTPPPTAAEPSDIDGGQ